MSHSRVADASLRSVTADPAQEGDGGRYFATNTDRVIYQDSTTFAKDMPETGAPGHGVEIK